jgi:hypothetical protein
MQTYPEEKGIVSLQKFCQSDLALNPTCFLKSSWITSMINLNILNSHGRKKRTRSCPYWIYVPQGIKIDDYPTRYRMRKLIWINTYMRNHTSTKLGWFKHRIQFLWKQWLHTKGYFKLKLEGLHNLMKIEFGPSSNRC